MAENITRGIVMFLTGGIVYFYFEIFVRGYSHISMFLLGGLCFCIVGGIGVNILHMNKLLLVRLISIMLIASFVITSLELVTGMIVNMHLKLHVWDYSQMKFNYKGQICLLYSGIWSLLGLPCVYFYGLIDKFVLGKGKTRSELNY
ncbi:MAG: hypothetical protein IKJ73_05535 [Lachnospiraceae bacterium]|nr:hypothetical protein [Lachnospiraceae bacterium]